MSWSEWSPEHDLDPAGWPVACIGPGRVGCALSRALADTGFSVVAVGGGSSGWDRLLADELGAEVVTEPYEDLGQEARLILITPPDRNLADAAAAVAAGAALKPGTFLVQTSATEPAGVLCPAEGGTDGVFCLSFHPLKPFPDRRLGLDHFTGTVIGIEGDEAARALGRRLAGMLRGHPLDISRQDKAVYHAVGVMAFTGVMALARAAAVAAGEMDLDPAFMDKGILPGMSAAAEAIRELGLPGGLTGPISRGDVEVVTSHMEVLSERFPGLVPIYREIGLLNLRMLEEERGLDGDLVERIKKVLCR